VGNYKYGCLDRDDKKAQIAKIAWEKRKDIISQIIWIAWIVGMEEVA